MFLSYESKRKENHGNLIVVGGCKKDKLRIPSVSLLQLEIA
jgi:hypothetical protein